MPSRGRSRRPSRRPEQAGDGDPIVLASADLVAFVPTVDAARARIFYAETLGLALIEETSFGCVFRAHGTLVRVTLVEELAPAPYTVLGWLVADIGATIAGLRERGIQFARYEGLGQDDLGVWRSPSGALIAWFHDPDGNTLSLTEA